MVTLEIILYHSKMLGFLNKFKNFCVKNRLLFQKIGNFMQMFLMKTDNSL